LLKPLDFPKVNFDDIYSHMISRSQLPLTSYALTRFSIIEATVCPICMERAPDTVTVCGHWFCKECLAQSLIGKTQCPCCKTHLRRKFDIVSIKVPIASTMEIWLEQYLRAHIDQKIILMSSFGEVHEKLGSKMRKNGLNVTAWRGSIAQLIKTYSKFNSVDSGVLLVDEASSINTRWVSFKNVFKVVILQPLKNTTNDVCCQVRDVLACCNPTQIEVVARRSTSGIPELPTCMSRKCRCPMLVQVAGASV
jgi:hypothetical protein